MSNKILIVASNYYKDISDNLIKHASKFLKEQEKLDINYDVVTTYGSFEIPFIINQNLRSYDGFIALGCIIRGETYHFELIANEVTRKIMDLAITSNKPIGFGIITSDNMEQARARSHPTSSKKRNIAGNAAMAVLELLLRQ